jgi:hypothetical protein
MVGQPVLEEVGVGAGVKQIVTVRVSVSVTVRASEMMRL